MKHIAWTTFLLCLLVTSEGTSAQTWNQVYNLDMSSRKNWSVSFHPYIKSGFDSRIQYDSIPDADGKKLRFDYGCMSKLVGRVLLPKTDGDSRCEVSVTLRADSICQPLTLELYLYDRNETLTASPHTTFTPQGEQWQEYSVELPHINDLNELCILLGYLPESAPLKSTVWIDRFTIRIDGEDIGEWNMADRLTTAPAVLDPRCTVPLDPDNRKKNLASQIGNLNRQRFIALGECTHGSAPIKEMRLRFCKDLILRHKVRFLIFEQDAIPFLALNFYIHGYDLPNMERYMDYVDRHYGFGKRFIDFLEWLRRYNQTHGQKISILGMDTANANRKAEVLQFFKDLLPGEEADLCCRLFEKGHYIELKNTVKRNDRLHKAMGDRLFDLLMATLECADFMLGDYGGPRDRNMFQFVTYLDKRVFGLKERAVILAHSLHTCYMIPHNYEKNLGYMMRERYSGDYFSMAFQVGEGEYLQDKPADDSAPKTPEYMFADTLRTPVEGSFESAAMRTGLEYLYYPAAALDDHTAYLSTILRRDDKGTHYKLCNLRSCHDGYVFIRRSRPCENYVPKTIVQSPAD